jgi:hypothetical protein
MPTPPPKESYPIPSTAKTWPVSFPPSQANIIFVRPDWSDLEAVVMYLEANPEIAKEIARRQRDTFVKKGYGGEAAEACYWRAALRAWGDNVRVDEEEWVEGVRWETFSLREKVEWN